MTKTALASKRTTLFSYGFEFLVGEGWSQKWKKKVRKIGLKIEINKNENDKQESSDNYSELPGEN